MKKKSHAALFIGCLMASCIIIPIVFLFVSWQTNKIENTPPRKTDLAATEVPASSSPEKAHEDVTENTEAAVSSESMTTVNASYFDVTQKTKTSYMPSALHITDTTINVQCKEKRSCEFNGPCVLDGSANVTYVGGGSYAPLQVGVKNGDTVRIFDFEFEFID